jgi:antitoxin FitA
MSTTVVIRNLDPGVKQKLQLRAARHQRSMEAEIRAILADAVRRPDSPPAGLTPAQRAQHSMEQTLGAPLNPALVAHLQRHTVARPAPRRPFDSLPASMPQNWPSPPPAPAPQPNAVKPPAR